MSMKRLLLSAAMLLVFFCASAQKNDVTKETFTSFIPVENIPHLENILPGPPEINSVRFQDDWAQYQWGKSIRDTERGQLAVKDANISVEYFMQRFSPAMGCELSPEEYPQLYRLLSCARRTEHNVGAHAKEYYRRVRPYQLFREATAVPKSENPTDFTSYPSGHTHSSWLIGMILTAIDPSHADDIMKTAFEYGQSRVIVGFHYQSDIEAGRYAASVTFACIASDPRFQKMLKKAIDEFEKNGRRQK